MIINRLKNIWIPGKMTLLNHYVDDFMPNGNERNGKMIRGRRYPQSRTEINTHNSTWNTITIKDIYDYPTRMD